MDILKELVSVVTRFKVRKINIITRDSDTPTMVREFYEGLVEDKFQTDEDAADYFYDSSDSKKKSSYKKLKSNVRNRLINTVFFIDVKQPFYNEQQRAYYTCYKEWAAAKILIGKSARNAGNYLCQKILPKAIKYEFTDIVLDVSRSLRYHYGIFEQNLKRFDYYNALAKKYFEISQAENLAEELYIALVSKYVNNHSQNANTPKIALEFAEQLKEPMEKYDSYRLHLFGNFIKITASMSTNNYAETIEVCAKALDFFAAKDYQTKLPALVFLHQQLVCYTQLRMFEEGKTAVYRGFDLLEEGQHNWFKHQELFLILSLHTGNYNEAYRIYQEVINNKRFKSLSTAVLEMWKIYEAYLEYLITINRIELSEKEHSSKKFRLNKFLNEVPGYSKEKRGRNIPILVIQILFLIVQKKYDTAIDRIEAVEKYCFRYLQNNNSFRSNCFLKMILQIPISGFHKNGTIRRAKKYVDRLQTVPLEVANQTHEVEIIPYEELWEIALESLENKFSKYKSRIK